jgi:hypothetical protein
VSGWISQTLQLSFNERDAADKEGKVAFDQSVNLPKGNDYLYLVVWDPATGRVGALGVPVEVRLSPK